jgi:predicted nicotinamide N-methyase
LCRRGHSLVLGHQIIQSIRHGTLMRHVIFAHPVAACSRRMVDAAAAARLVTPTGVALRASARFPSTALDAVHMAAIAMAADQNLDPAALAQEQPRRRSNNFFVAITARMCGSTLVP